MERSILFLAVFVGGPILFHIGLRLAQRYSKELWVMLIALTLFLLGVALETRAGPGWGVDRALLFLGLLSIWLGWIAVLIFCVMRFQRAAPNARMKRWTQAFGAIGTTVPWFGFAWAQMAAG